MLAPTSKCPIVSISVMQQNNNNLTAFGFINDIQHTLTIDTGATESTIRLDVVKGKCEALSNMRLRTAAGESATVHGRTEVKVRIGNVRVSHVFIVADIVDGVIFAIAHGINFNMGQQIMSCRNVEILLEGEISIKRTPEG